MARRVLILGLAVAMSCPALADDLPHRKPGLWTMTLPSPGAGGVAREMRMCIDAATDTAMQNMGTSMANCTKHEVKRSGDTFTTDSVCTMQGSVMTTHSVATMTGDTGYHSETTASISPPIAGMGSSKVISDGKYVGACPANMKPGDMMMNGQVINMLNHG